MTRIHNLYMPCNDLFQDDPPVPIKPKKTEVKTGRNITVRFLLLCLMKWLWSFSFLGLHRLEQ